jgi:Lsr2
MAQRVVVEFDDDLGGGPADETVHFALDGRAYEIDLNEPNAAAFRQRIAPFIEHARPAGPGTSSGRPGGRRNHP